MWIKLTVTILGTVFAFVGALHAKSIPGSSIVVHSPFLPSDFNPPGESGLNAQPPTTQSQFQFNGVYQLDGEYYFHIYDQRSQRGSWIGRNSLIDGYPSVIEFDESRDTLVVELNGIRLQLEMEETTSQSMAISRGNSTMQTDSSSGSQNIAQSYGPAIRRPVIRATQQETGPAPLRRVTFSTRQFNN